MGNFTVSHDLHGEPAAFFGWFFDRSRAEDLYQGHLGYVDYSTISLADADGQLTRTTTFAKPMSLPGPVAKLLGSGFRQTEDGQFNKSTRVYQWKVTPSTIADKLREEGTLRAEERGDGCRIIVDYELEAKVFGVGGLLESTIEKNLREEWDQIAGFYNRQAAA